MLLAIDVGNTNIVLGVFRGATLGESWRLATMRERTADEIGIWTTHLFEHRGLRIVDVEGVIVASVVPSLTQSIVWMAERYFGTRPLVVTATSDTGMPVLYDSPSEVGADRIVNAVAALNRHGRPGLPLIVLDFGTATTFDAVSAKGEYLGGVICPGVQISADALFQRAAQLPRVAVEKPAGLIGRNTVAAMQAGLFYGYVAMVEGIVRRLRRELLPERPDEVPCIATGGLAEVIAAETSIIEACDPDLTLHGLRLLWDRAKGSHG